MDDTINQLSPPSTTGSAKEESVRKEQSSRRMTLNYILFLILGLFLGFVGYLLIDHHYYRSEKIHFQKSDTLHFEDGSIYLGEINAAKQPHGYGMLTTTEGKRMTGEWTNGRLNK